MEHLSRECLEAGLGQIRDSPQDGGRLVLIVRLWEGFAKRILD